MKVIGMDPGIRNFGICVGHIHLGGSNVAFSKMTTMRTTPCKELSAAQDLIMRCDNLTRDLDYYVNEGQEVHDVYAVCIEGFSRPPNVTSAIKLGAANGVVGALVERWCPEVIYIRSPQDIRRGVLPMPSKKVPAEEDVHAALLGRYDEVAVWKAVTPKYMHEHVLDAVAAVEAAKEEGAFLP